MRSMASVAAKRGCSGSVSGRCGHSMNAAPDIRNETLQADEKLREVFRSMSQRQQGFTLLVPFETVVQCPGQKRIWFKT